MSDFNFENVDQLDSCDLQVPPDNLLMTTLNTRVLEEEIKKKIMVITSTKTWSSLLLSTSFVTL
jgi:hypothetical protein